MAKSTLALKHSKYAWSPRVKFTHSHIPLALLLLCHILCVIPICTDAVAIVCWQANAAAMDTLITDLRSKLSVVKQGLCLVIAPSLCCHCVAGSVSTECSLRDYCCARCRWRSAIAGQASVAQQVVCA